LAKFAAEIVVDGNGDHQSGIRLTSDAETLFHGTFGRESPRTLKSL
jgi:hypothetical protein